jgi:hypothetical protein
VNLTGLAANTTYYYRIAAQNTGGTVKGSIVSFTTAAVRTLTVASSNPSTGVTVSVSPLDKSGLGNGTTLFTRSYDNNTTVTLTAAASSGSNTFQKWQRDGIDLSANAAVNVVMDANHTLTAVYIVPPPATVELLSPVNGATAQPTSPNLSWIASAGALTYRLQVSTSSTFATMVVDDSTITTTSRQVTGLAGNTTYYWRVSAKSAGGVSAWSLQWSFTTKKGGKIRVAAKTLNFGTVPLGTSKKDSFSITNVGDTTVNVTNIATTDLVFEVSPTGMPLAPGDTVEIYVSASPKNPNPSIGWVIITYDSDLLPDTVLAQVDSVDITSGVNDGAGDLPAEFALYQNYPNPFNPSTTIRYALKEESEVTLIVYNAYGQEVATLVDGVEHAGVHQVVFDGGQLASGIYFYKLRAGSDIAVKKLTLLK